MRRIILICGAFALLACLDLGIPLWVLAGRAAILRNGTEVRLELTTRDPRDVFRGEYSRLGYTIGNPSNVPATAEERARCPTDARPECRTENGQPVFVVLAAADNGTWRAVQASQIEPAPGTLFIRGKVTFGGFSVATNDKCPSGRCFSGRVEYGIENWFGPQGVPAKVDQAARNQVIAVVRIDGHGKAVLADLLVNGVVVGR